jgi:hypothetical protein
MSDERYTVDQLAEYSGYSVGTIYDLTHFGIISPPARGVDPKQYSSKGSYPAIVLQQLDRYKELKMQGLKKSEIISIMKAEGEDVSLRQG